MAVVACESVLMTDERHAREREPLGDGDREEHAGEVRCALEHETVDGDARLLGGAERTVGLGRRGFEPQHRPSGLPGDDDAAGGSERCSEPVAVDAGREEERAPLGVRLLEGREDRRGVVAPAVAAGPVRSDIDDDALAQRWPARQWRGRDRGRAEGGGDADRGAHGRGKHPGGGQASCTDEKAAPCDADGDQLPLRLSAPAAGVTVGSRDHPPADVRSARTVARNSAVPTTRTSSSGNRYLARTKNRVGTARLVNT